MDIDLLSRMIGTLIVEHDQVGLPGVGTFVAEMMPASFADRGYTIHPPYRRLSFYPSQSEDTQTRSWTSSRPGSACVPSP